MPETTPPASQLKPLTLMLPEADHARLRRLVALGAALTGQATTPEMIVTVLMLDREDEWLALAESIKGTD